MDIEEYVSHKVCSIELSLIRKFSNLVSQVPGAISLTIGQPDFTTPENIKYAGIQAIINNYTSYTHNQGSIELRKEISKFLKSKHNMYYDAESEITVTIGASQAIDTVMRTFIDDGDEVLIPSPSYTAYGTCVTLSGGRPVYVPIFIEDGFRLKAEVLEQYITPKTKLLILSYPSNPTGATLEIEDLHQIAEVVKNHNIVVVSDEIYSALTYGKRHVSIASISGMKNRTIVINGFSKHYSMTGWRLGYVAAPSSVMKHIVKVHQYNVSCASSISQAAGLEALLNGEHSVELMRQEYDNRRKYCYERIISMGLKCLEPTGAFYLFPQIKGYSLLSEEFCKRLLYEGKLAIVPGTAFGKFGEGYIRISYAYSFDILEEGLKRLKNFLHTL